MERHKRVHHQSIIAEGSLKPIKRALAQAKIVENKIPGEKVICTKWFIFEFQQTIFIIFRSQRKWFALETEACLNSVVAKETVVAHLFATSEVDGCSMVQ